MLVTEYLCWTTHVKTKPAKCIKIFNFLKRSIPFQVSNLHKKNVEPNDEFSCLFYCFLAWCVTIGILKVLENFSANCCAGLLGF